MSSIHQRLAAALEGRYTVEREAGGGGMALVFLARDLKHDRPVALKVLRPELASAVGADRFLREIRLTAKLLHPHILPLYDSGESDGLIWYAMPFVEGKTLADRLRREGQLPVNEAVRITREVASALGHAHQHGVVHRDVKPANILFESGKAVVADFGIARVVDDAASPSLTSTDVVVGTPLYMSPEQSAGDPVDARSDVYALGAILYEMLAGVPPYHGPNAAVILQRRITEPLPSVRAVRPSVPEAVDDAIRKALEKSPADRFQDVAELESALAAAGPAVAGAGRAAEHPTGDRSGRVPTTRDEDGGRRTPRVALRWGIAGLIPILGVAAAVWGPSLLDRGPDDDGLGLATIRQVTLEAGPELFPTLSPDGARVAYARDGDLWVRDLGSGSDRRLTEAPQDDNRHAAFAPDGRRLVFRSEREGGGLFILDLDAGPDAPPARLTNHGYNPSWAPDGARVVFAEEGVAEPTTRRGVSRLFVVDVAGGQESPLGTMDGVQPSWSPDGSRIAFWSVVRDGQLTGQRDLWTVRPDGTGLVDVTDDAAVDWNPVWSADGRHLLFSSDRGGSMNLWAVRVDGATGEALAPPEPVTSGGSASREHLTVAGGGGLAVYAERLTTSNILKVPFDPEAGEVTGPAVDVTTGNRMALEPSVSPDGSRVAFYTLDDEMHVFVAATDGSSGVRRVTGGDARYRSPQWSPDGERIAMHSDRGGTYQIWTVDTAGTEYRQVQQSGGPTIYPFWSPDGERIGFVELQRAIAAVPAGGDAPGSAETLLRGDLMVRPQWSPDGRRIAGVLPPAAGGTGIVVYEVGGRSPVTVSAFGDAPQWLPDGRRLVFAFKNALWLGDVVTGETREILAYPRDQLGLGSLTPDGRWIYFSRTVTEADLWSVEWR